MRSTYHYLFISLIFMISSCASIKPVEVRKIEQVKIGPEKNANAGFDLVIYNPNRFGLKLRNAAADFSFDNKIIGKAYTDRSVKIPASAESRISFRLDFDQSHLIQSLLPSGIDMLLGGKGIEIRSNGKIKLRKFILSKEYKFDISRKLDMQMIRSMLNN